MRTLRLVPAVARLTFLLALSAGALCSLPALQDAQAAGRRPYGGTVRVALPTWAGWDDPHRARTGDARWLAGWVHCGLLRTTPSGDVRGDLATDPGRWAQRTLTLRLVDGASFHDGAPVTAGDVVDSLRRLAGLEASGGTGLLAGALQVGAPDPLTVTIRAPAGVSGGAVRRLLARAEVAVLREGRPGPRRGCGAFIGTPSQDRLELSAFARHARGRPWIDRIIVRAIPEPRDRAAAMAFGEIEMTSVPGRRYRDTRRVDDAGDVTVLAVVHPRWRGEPGASMRRTLASAARACQLDLDALASPIAPLHQHPRQAPLG